MDKNKGITVETLEEYDRLVKEGYKCVAYSEEPRGMTGKELPKWVDVVKGEDDAVEVGKQTRG